MNTNESWQTLAKRGQGSTAIWRTHSAGFTFGEVTLPLHQDDVDALPVAAQAVVTQEDAVDTARAARDGKIAIIKDLAIRFPRKLDGELSARDSFHSDLRHIRAVEMDGISSVTTRGQRAFSLWMKFNARRVAAGGTPFLVGGLSVTVLGDALESLPDMTQLVANEVSTLNDLRDDLLKLKDRVDTNNKRWYAAWEGEFLAGSAERNALSQIDTGGGGGQAALGTPTLSLAMEALTVTLTMVLEGATSFRVYRKAQGEEDFTVRAESVASGWTEDLLAGSGEHLYRVTGLRGTEESEPSVASIIGA